MKKIISLLLALVMAFSCSVVIFAKGNTESTSMEAPAPLIIISGFGTVPLFNYDGKEPLQVFGPTGKTIWSNVSKVLFPTVTAVITRNWDRMSDLLGKAANGIFESARCDENGNSVYKTDVIYYPGKAVQYPEFYNGDYRDEAAFVKTAIETIGADMTYFFSYDWRMDPMDHAKALRTYISEVQKETGSEKVILAACSMGGTVLMSYLQQFGSDDVFACVLDNTAFQGISMVGEMFRKDFSVEKVSMVEYALQFSKMKDSTRKFLTKLILALPVTDHIIHFAQDLLDNTKDRIAPEVLYPLFGYMPGMWAFVSEEDYEPAKEMALDSVKNAELIRKIDNYHYNVQCKVKDILDDTMDNGCIVTILANYGKRSIPLTSSKEISDDYLIDTSLASGGAICADYNKTLPENYVQQVNDGHNHLSPDRMIDASTCMYPEYTWFVKDMGHLDYPYGSEGATFLMWLVCAKSQPDIYTNVTYPQFMIYNALNMTLSPLS